METLAKTVVMMSMNSPIRSIMMPYEKLAGFKYAMCLPIP